MMPPIIPLLETRVLALLNAHPKGLSEYELLRALEPELAPVESTDPGLRLFRRHFLLFHVLYRLRDRLWGEGQGDLAISPLCVRLQPYLRGRLGLMRHDPLRAYYLDLREWSGTTAHDVASLMSDFWRRLSARQQLTAALAVFGLESLPGNFEPVRRHYKRLAMLHHPDRGGDGARLQELNAALAVVRRYYGL